MHQPRPGTARRTHAPQTGPAKRPGAGTFQLLEGITTSVHHLLYLFSAHDHRRAAAKTKPGSMFRHGDDPMRLYAR